MIEVLLGVPAKVKTLVDRLTATRAARLDYLDAAISSRAPASTAASNAVWTDPRAAKLDTVALETTPLLAAPKVAGLIPQAPTAVTLSATTDVYTKNSGLEHLAVTSTSYVNAVNYTGKGVLEFAAAQHDTNSMTTTMKITIDGVSNIEAPVVGSGFTGTVAAMVGVINSSAQVSLAAIPFKTSLKIEVKVTAGTGRSFIKYRKVA
ncbi:hypothetical protein [Candidatus Nitrotoga sp. M5]|uniref:hypothetical protein n=1 Tax=Candidatus Nitrotoga sp. M5 TaxID=2890409 RepID=UPI001EF59CC9|nr:hypothetical protein [Candidatus Nitrotoga sp. M5]CAH1387012.1 conserved hypothetical protein [Candidatus Nitrotoga sp. M5]